VVEYNLAKVGVAGSNPVSRSIFYNQDHSEHRKRQRLSANIFSASFAFSAVINIGGVAKWLRRRSAKPLFSGSNPLAASISTTYNGRVCKDKLH
jgi:hypothetical protein